MSEEWGAVSSLQGLSLPQPINEFGGANYLPKNPSFRFQIGSGWNLVGLFFEKIRIHRRLTPMKVQVYMTSYFQDAYAAASASCPRARHGCVTPLARCMHALQFLIHVQYIRKCSTRKALKSIAHPATINAGRLKLNQDTRKRLRSARRCKVSDFQQMSCLVQ